MNHWNFYLVKYDYIDSLRGVAIIMVILVHTSHSVGVIDGWVGYLAKYGQMGVQLFFVVSAYTLCMSFDARKGESRSSRNFFIRRFFRIAPIYYIGIVGYFTYRSLLASVKSGTLVFPEQYSFLNILANVFFVHGLYPPANNSIVPGGWSIGTEMLFYLVFPLMFFFTGKLHSRFSLLTLPLFIFAIVFLPLAFSNYEVGNNSFIYFSLLNQAPVFAVGIALYWLLNKSGEMIGVNSFGGLTLAISIFLILTYLSIWLGWIEQAGFRGKMVVVPFISALSFSVLLVLFRSYDLLNANIIRRIGVRSYSMYLIHFVFAQQGASVLNKYVLNNWFESDIRLAISVLFVLVCTYFLAGLTHKYIESYFIHCGHRIIEKRRYNA